MGKKVKEISAEFFSYEEFCVYEIIKEKNKGINIIGPKIGDDLPLSLGLYAPDGIPSLGLKGKTIVEVKNHLSFATIKDIGILFDKYGSEYNFLIVYFKVSVTNYQPLLTNSEGRKLEYVPFKELKGKKKNRTEKGKSDYYTEKTKKSDWKQEREELIKKAQDAVSLGSNALFLGAGVSMSAKMPSWKELLKGLMGEVKQLETQTLDAFKELSSQILEECGDSNLIMGRFLQTAISLYDNKAVFSELIQKYLYNDNDTSQLLVNLARIIQQKKVNEVITYNFDDLLEQNLTKISLTDSIDYTSISKDAEIKGHNTLPIYHVHGIIPKEGPVDTVVFSEEEYHKRYSTAFHWSNVEQLHALTRMHCFFVGLSMTDPNLRRLLDAAKEMNKSNETNHFAFLKRKKLEKYCLSDVNKTCRYVHISESLIDKKKQKDIYDLNYAVLENIFVELGVNVIWYEDHEVELPYLLSQVFGLTQYEGMDKKTLISLCDNLIIRIKKFEVDYLLRKDNKNDKELDFMQMYKMLKTVKEKAIEYREMISEVRDMLNVLSNGIDFDTMSENKINEIQKKVTHYGNNMEGYGDFFKLWLDTVRVFYES